MIAPSITNAAAILRNHSFSGICESKAANPKYDNRIPAITEKIPLVERITLPKTGCKNA